MKRLIYFGASILMLPMFFSSCLKEDDDVYYLEMGNIKGNSEEFVLVTDRGDTLFPSENNAPQFPITDNKRVWINYTILSESTDATYDYMVRVNNLTSILTKDTVMLSPENVDSIGNDPLIIDDYWIANDYLNIVFAYYGSGSVVHYINMAMNPSEQTLQDGTPLFEMKHNSNGDSYNSLAYGTISIDLRPFKTGESGSYKFQLRSLGYHDTFDFDKLFVYKWGQTVTE